MDKEQIKEELIIPKIGSGEELVGFFQATSMPSFWWFFFNWAFSIFEHKNLLCSDN